MTAQWYFAIQGRTLGPVTSEDLRQRAGRGEIGGADLVWREGMSDWAPADSLGLATSVTPPPFPGASRSDVARSGGPAPGTATPPSAPPPSAADPIASPPPIGPPRIQPPAGRVVVEPAPTRSTRGREQHARQTPPNPRATGAPAALRAVWWVIGIVAILACGFWVGRVVGTKSIDDTQTAAVAGQSPNARQGNRGKHAADATDAATSRLVAARDADTDSGTPPGFSSPTAAGLTTNSSSTNSPPPTNMPPTNPPGRDATVDPDTRDRPADFAPSAAALPPAVPATPAPVTEPAKSPLDARPPLADSPLPASPLPAGDPVPEDRGPRVLFQTLEIHRKPTFVVQGMTLPQELRYRIISRLEIAAQAADGSRKVVQIVENTHLDHADDLSRATFAKSLAALQRQQYTFKLNEHHEVIEFSGPKKNLLSLPVTLPDGKGLQLTSVIDEDGWKELAQFTFFQPDDGVAQGQAYVRQITHDWTPLGIWSGTTTFTGDEARGDLQSIRFRHALTYTPPAAKDAAGPLGFRVVSAECTIDQADGMLEYDRQRKRVTNARETFQVHGSVATELLGQPVNIQMQEQQLMTIRVTDQRPEQGTKE